MTRPSGRSPEGTPSMPESSPLNPTNAYDLFGLGGEMGAAHAGVGLVQHTPG